MPTGRQPTRFVNAADDPLRPQNPLVTRRWMGIAIACMLLAAALAVYGALVLLFWQGQWQLIYHPTNAITQTPAIYQIAFNDVRFGAGETGQPQLRGWWLPANPDVRRSSTTVLYLHEARGSLSDTLPDLLALHALGVDVFAFDPRGFGQSNWVKPSEEHWNQDAEAALAYISGVRHVSDQNIVPIGRGLGATVAADLAGRHPEIHALVMVDPQPPTIALLQGPSWTHILPVHLLARDTFDPGPALRTSHATKLFLTTTPPPYLGAATAPARSVSSTTLGDAQTAPALHQLLEEVSLNN